jgi:hypothetical protein
MDREGESAKNESLRQTRDLLLPKLISGEVDLAVFTFNDEAGTG